MPSLRPCGGCEPPLAPSRLSRSSATTRRTIWQRRRMSQSSAQGWRTQGGCPRRSESKPALLTRALSYPNWRTVSQALDELMRKLLVVHRLLEAEERLAERDLWGGRGNAGRFVSAFSSATRAHGSYAGRPRSPTTGRGRPRVSGECRPVRQRNAHDGGVTAAAVLAFLCPSMVRCSWSTTGCDRALHRPWAGHRRDGPSSTKGMAQAMTPEARDPSGVIAPVSRRRGQGASCPRSLVRARDPRVGPPARGRSALRGRCFPGRYRPGRRPGQGRKMPPLEPIWVAFVAVVLAG